MASSGDAREHVQFLRKYGRWAVVAGASEGVGACLAEQIAAPGPPQPGSGRPTAAPL